LTYSAAFRILAGDGPRKLAHEITPAERENGRHLPSVQV
jgi:hypothetical protein